MPNGPILIVDDQPENLAAIRQILSNEFDLVFARSGYEALEGVEKHKPALILLDIQLPDINGIELCKILKKNPITESIPIIFVTSLAEIGDEAAGFDVGAVDYIVKPISAPIVLARVRTHLSLVRASMLEQSHTDAISMLGIAGHYKDNDTGVHIWRMADYSEALASACGWNQAACQQLRLSAPMHDTGKIGIPESILQKPGKLNEAEWKIMRSHCQIGYDILSTSSAPLFKMAAEVALNHHEKWNGSGYPNGLSGSAIPESARIVAIADVFDALTMKRPYKEAWPVDKAFDTIALDAGKHFDPQIVDTLLTMKPRILEIKQIWESRAKKQE